MRLSTIMADNDAAVGQLWIGSNQLGGSFYAVLTVEMKDIRIQLMENVSAQQTFRVTYDRGIESRQPLLSFSGEGRP
jgi:hypothetical protein